MSKIIIGKANNHPVGFDLKTLITTRLLIEANSGGGKSYLLRVLCEQAFGKVQVIIVDREGEFSTLREQFDYVLVGKGGETPADTRSAAMLAHKLLELNASAVCDLYEMKDYDRHLWVKLFLEALLDAPKHLWHPVIVIIDEAHIFAPEKGSGESMASDAVIGLATRGRKRGFCAVLATQRLGKLRKDTAAEMLNILVGQTFIDIDRKRAAEALGIDKSGQKEFFSKLKTMEPGNFYALGRAISKDQILVSIGKVQTTHPEPGKSYKHAATPPPAPEKIKAMLPKLADLPKAAEEKAKTEKELRAEIQSLKVQLRTQPKEKEKVVTKVETVVQTVDMKPWKEFAREAKKAWEKAITMVDSARNRMQDAVEILQSFPKIPSGEIQTKEMPRVRSVLPSPVQPPQRISTNPRLEPLRRPLQGGKETGDGELRIIAGARRMLAAAATFYPKGITEGQIAAQAGVSRAGGSFGTYKSSLRTTGLLEERGGLFYATQAGMDFIGESIPDTPTDTEGVLKLWEPKFNAGARRMLRILVDLAGEPISYDELSAQAGVRGGSFGTYLSSLKTADLVITDKNVAMAKKETLFL